MQHATFRTADFFSDSLVFGPNLEKVVGGKMVNVSYNAFAIAVLGSKQLRIRVDTFCCTERVQIKTLKRLHCRRKYPPQIFPKRCRSNSNKGSIPPQKRLLVDLSMKSLRFAP